MDFPVSVPSILNQEDCLDLSTKTISQIANIIRKDWKNINYAAKPYWEAMQSLTNIKDDYYQDSGVSVVLYFLSNATSWRGETAKLVKKELNKRIKDARK